MDEGLLTDVVSNVNVGCECYKTPPPPCFRRMPWIDDSVGFNPTALRLEEREGECGGRVWEVRGECALRCGSDMRSQECAPKSSAPEAT